MNLEEPQECSSLTVSLKAKERENKKRRRSNKAHEHMEKEQFIFSGGD